MRHGILRRNAALAAVKNLILANLRRGRLVLDARRRVLHFQVGERVRAALVAQQHRVALRIVARTRCALQNLHRAAIGVLPVAGRNALRNNRAARVLSDVDHLGARVRLLIVVRQRHRIKFAHRVVAQQQAARDISR